MAPNILFRADAIPRYGEAEARGLTENLVSQRAFLTAMIVDHCSRQNATLEIRFAASGDGEIKTFIALHHEDEKVIDDSASPMTALMARLLPVDYGWRLSHDAKGYNAAIRGLVRVARIVRTAQIVDLPYVIPDFDGKSAETFAPLFDAYGALMGGGGAADDEAFPRALPDITEGPGQFREKRLCLPFLGDLGGWRTEMRVLLDQMLASAPAIISIMLRPLQESEIRDARMLSAGWKWMLNPFLPQLANSGFGDAGSLSRTFDRFAMPAAYLAQTSIRCAAEKDDAAAGLASVLAACLGGPTAFEVFHPHKPVGLKFLTHMDDDYPKPGIAGIEQGFIEEQRQRLENIGVTPPESDAALDFLARVNHVYTLDEVHALVQLPVADDDGLPGMPSRMAAPFSSPWVRGAEAENPIRIGLIQPRHADPLAGLAGRKTSQVFHRMSLEALTKHALIVGSTGSGKTLTTLFLTRELKRNKVPFLVIEPVKTEYYERLSHCMDGDIARWRFEGDRHGEEAADFLTFDPMTLQEGVTVARHASYLKSCFLAAFPLPPVEALLLEAGLRDYYTASAPELGCALKLFERGTVATSAWRDDPEANAEGGYVLKGDGTRKTEHMLHPSLSGFFKFFNVVFLPRKVMGQGDRKPRGKDAKAVMTRLQSLIDQGGEAGAPAAQMRAAFDDLKVALNAQQTQRTDNGRLAETLLLWRQMFARRFESIQSGPIGLAAARATRVFAETGEVASFQRILDRNTVVELDGIPDEEQKSLMMAFLLTALFERRQADDLAEREKPPAERAATVRGARHVMIVEEAHRVLSASGSSRSGEVAGLDAKSKSVSLFVDMLAEIRAFGQGIVIVEQIPTKIVSEAIKNTNLKIMLRLTSRDDREYLGEAMNFTESQKRFVTTLRAERGKGINMVVFEEGVEQPIMLSLPFDPTGPDWVFDELFQAPVA
jgi:hypothetical protein